MSSRIMALWFPDWPIQAAGLCAPAALASDHRIWVCDTKARDAGVRRGMRLREAQALCPKLSLATRDQDRDARIFSSIVAAVDEVVAAAEILRPGLVILDATAAAHYYGGEDTAGELLLDAVARRGSDCFLGVADSISTAVLAARYGQVVPQGKSRTFLDSLPLSILDIEPALGCDHDVLERLKDLGIHTLGQVANLPKSAMAARFSHAGVHCWNIAQEQADRHHGVVPATPPPDLSVSYFPEEAITRIDTAAFLARKLAHQLHQRLYQAGVICHRLRIKAEIQQEDLSRVWRTRDPLTESATAERVRWQVDAWLHSGGRGGLTALSLEPVEVSTPDSSDPLWGGRSERTQVQRVAQRVQTMLDCQAVVEPHSVGGRGVAERIRMRPFGEEDDIEQPHKAPWEGAILGPLPARLGGGPEHPAHRISLVDAQGQAVFVNQEALLTREPVAMGWGQQRFRVLAWAGPWPVDDLLAGGGRCARLQLVAQAEGEERPRAWLMVWLQGQWRIEASYV
ncbi:Y-family DNA polymerase [Corynebacterium poyangense]|nr:DNA polymerase Y family protein [Corynebacterium poyangense]